MEWIKGCVLFTDVENSSKMWENHRDIMGKIIIEHEQRIQKHVEKYNGWVVKSIGDALMCFFKDKNNAKHAANDIQKDLSTNPVIIKTQPLKIRIGICCGNLQKRHIVIQGKTLIDFMGPTVNKASRMESDLSPSGGFAVCGDFINPSSRAAPSKGTPRPKVQSFFLFFCCFALVTTLFFFICHRHRKC